MLWISRSQICLTKFQAFQNNSQTLKIKNCTAWLEGAGDLPIIHPRIIIWKTLQGYAAKHLKKIFNKIITTCLSVRAIHLELVDSFSSLWDILPCIMCLLIMDARSKVWFFLVFLFEHLEYFICGILFIFMKAMQIFIGIRTFLCSHH